MTISPNRVSKEMWELALVAPRSKIKIWGDKYLPTLLVVSKAVMAVIPDPLADKRKVAMRRQPYGMILFTLVLAVSLNLATRSYFAPRLSWCNASRQSMCSKS